MPPIAKEKISFEVKFVQNAVHTFIGFVDIKYFVPALLGDDIE